MAARFIYEGKSARGKRISRLATMSRVENVFKLQQRGGRQQVAAGMKLFSRWKSLFSRKRIFKRGFNEK